MARRLTLTLPLALTLPLPLTPLLTLTLTLTLTLGEWLDASTFRVEVLNPSPAGFASTPCGVAPAPACVPVDQRTQARP